jgi:CheY-like chemotaxis protein
MASVLVVEQDPATRSLVHHWLADHGHEVREVPSGESALEALAEAPPDLVLLDERLPGIDGFEVARRTAGLRDGDEVPVLMLTPSGTTPPRDVEIDGWLAMPFTDRQLTTAIERTLAVKLEAA